MSGKIEQASPGFLATIERFEMVGMLEALNKQIMHHGQITSGKNDVALGLGRLTVFPAAAAWYRCCVCWFHIFHCSRERTSTNPRQWIAGLTLFLADAYRRFDCQGENACRSMRPRWPSSERITNV